MLCLPCALQASYSRLAPEADVRPLAEQALALARPVEEDAGREFGRGKRDRGSVSYRDLGEREFKRLCRWGGRVGGLGAAAAAAAQPSNGSGQHSGTAQCHVLQCSAVPCRAAQRSNAHGMQLVTA